MVVGIVLISILIVIMFWFYNWSTKQENILNVQEIPHEKPFPIVGNVFPVISQREGIRQFIERYYGLFPNDR
jgi:hypothetical protein